MKTPIVKVFIKDSGRDISDFVESVRFEQALEVDNFAEFDLRAGNGYSVVDDDDIVSGTILRFQFGYLGQEMSPLHEIRITDIDTDYGQRVKFKVKCLDLGNVMRKVSEQTIWKQLTSSQIAEQIASKYGLTPQIQATTYVWAVLPQGNRDDFELLTYLASKESNGDFVFHIQNNLLIFEKKDFDKASTVKYTYGTNIISFKPKLREAKQSGAANNVNVLSVDALTKQKINVSNTDTSTLLGDNSMKLIMGDTPTKTDKDLPKTTNKGTAYDWDGNPIKKGASDNTPVTAKKTVFSGSADRNEMQNLANSTFKRNNEKILEATLNIEGNPLLKLSDIITISNVALRHSGNWKIEKISHSIGSSAYTTTVTLSKNGTTKAANKDEVTTPTTGTTVNKTEGKGTGDTKKTVKYYDWNGDKKNK